MTNRLNIKDFKSVSRVFVLVCFVTSISRGDGGVRWGIGLVDRHEFHMIKPHSMTSAEDTLL